ncbi:hypothetical protein B0T25DRAFT_128560 [Lasiosphaeria hispida]|uniref:Uncharacterized protein n=1 Tax=Lasiosphaeria hispida TaxID=260671 RepID=A0AAJ0HS05_9PEZI|nr:hypothetical protein B0T25DRAFT_128560 [Lasiosphaeria hispida]
MIDLGTQGSPTKLKPPVAPTATSRNPLYQTNQSYGTMNSHRNQWSAPPNKAHRKESKHHSKDTSSRSHGSSKTDQGSRKSHKSASHGTASDVSFLFVVNEFVIDLEPPHHEVVDQWLNFLPPILPSGYLGEAIGTVFRYSSGAITRADEYLWHRPHMGQPGSILRLDSENNVSGTAIPYQSRSIFSCSAHLPLIVLEGDASLGSTLRTGCACGSTSSSADEDLPAWDMLHFSDKGIGISLAATHASGYPGPYVVGRNPSWMPSLVPVSFANTRPEHVPQSRGLSGDVAIVIGLMAFHSRPGEASNVFGGGCWRYGQWNPPGNGAPCYPASGDSPRGFLINVCLDLVEGEDLPNTNLNREWCVQQIYQLEWEGGILVEG